MQLTKTQSSDADIRVALKNSLYIGASDGSVDMVLAYCRAAGLDPMQKPVHIVPMWDSKSGGMRDVIMPGIGLYRTQASRSGEMAGVSEPIYGEDVQGELSGVKFTYPSWCKVTVKRLLPNGTVAEFVATERWIENYAVKGGKEKSLAPNAMWQKRPYGQIAKCAEAQALRKAFPELGAAPTADEMEGKTLHEVDMGAATVTAKNELTAPATKPSLTTEMFSSKREKWAKSPKTATELIDTLESVYTLSDAQKSEITALKAAVVDDLAAAYTAAEETL